MAESCYIRRDYKGQAISDRKAVNTGYYMGLRWLLCRGCQGTITGIAHALRHTSLPQTSCMSLNNKYFRISAMLSALILTFIMGVSKYTKGRETV